MTKGARFWQTAPVFAFLCTAAVIFTACVGDMPGIAESFRHSLAFAKALNTAPGDGEIYVCIIDVGQGDSILICSNEGNILIDAGTDSSEAAVRAHLNACGVDTIDYFFCTHPHDDHIGGADAVLETYSVGSLIMPNVAESSTSFEELLAAAESSQTPLIYPECGDIYTVGDITVTVLAPVEFSEDLNGMSLVLKLTFGESTFIFTGDADESSEALMLDTYQSGELDCDFLKVAHHGADTSSSEAFIGAVSPSIAVISCGKYNGFGHPHKDTIERLLASGCENVLRTDTVGTVILYSNGGEPSVAAVQDIP